MQILVQMFLLRISTIVAIFNQKDNCNLEAISVFFPSVIIILFFAYQLLFVTKKSRQTLTHRIRFGRSRIEFDSLSRKFFRFLTFQLIAHWFIHLHAFNRLPPLINVFQSGEYILMSCSFWMAKAIQNYVNFMCRKITNNLSMCLSMLQKNQDERTTHFDIYSGVQIYAFFSIFRFLQPFQLSQQSIVMKIKNENILIRMNCMWK